MLPELLNLNVKVSDEAFTELFKTSNKHLEYLHFASRNMLDASILYL